MKQRKWGSLWLAVLLAVATMVVTVGAADINLPDIGVEVIVDMVDVYTPTGDVNGDGAVNNKDMTRMKKYIAGDSVEVNEIGMDTTGDGSINNKDMTRLKKYLAQAEGAELAMLTDRVLADSVFTFVQTAKGYGLSGYTGAYGGVAIPSTYRGLPVTTICDGAFADCQNLTYISIPSSVTSIGNEAFRGCTSLTSVTFEITSGWTSGNVTMLATDLADPATAATHLKATYSLYTWTRN